MWLKITLGFQAYCCRQMVLDPSLLVEVDTDPVLTLWLTAALSPSWTLGALLLLLDAASAAALLLKITFLNSTPFDLTGLSDQDFC